MSKVLMAIKIGWKAYRVIRTIDPADIKAFVDKIKKAIS